MIRLRVLVKLKKRKRKKETVVVQNGKWTKTKKQKQNGGAGGSWHLRESFYGKLNCRECKGFVQEMLLVSKILFISNFFNTNLCNFLKIQIAMKSHSSMPRTSNLAILLLLTCSLYFWHRPFFDYWQGHVTLSRNVLRFWLDSNNTEYCLKNVFTLKVWVFQFLIELQIHHF